MSYLNEEYPDLLWNGEEKLPIIVSFGAGVDSTAILVGLHERGIKPNHIIFSDTGAERPDIYAHIKKVDEWCKEVGFPAVEIVRYTSKNGDRYLIDDCIENTTLPSLAFGFKTCSLKYKTRPNQKYIVKDLGIKKYIKVLGYGVGEIDRAIKSCESIKNEKVQFYKGEVMKMWFPLIDWKLDRNDCKELSKTVGFCTAKSSCYFCPAMKLSEVLMLKKNYPKLYQKSIDIEKKAMDKFKEDHRMIVNQAVERFGSNWAFVDEGIYKSEGLKYPKDYSVKGLGRNWNWKDTVETMSPELPFDDLQGADGGCGCTDF